MYEVFEEKLFTEDDEEYIAYGIMCAETNERISDVSTNKDKLHEFIKMLNGSDLQKTHLRDVIEDYLDELI